MGVKSTIYLTREEAEEKYRFLYERVYKPRTLLSDSQLEDELERLNDIYNGGEGFENYYIKAIWEK